MANNGIDWVRQVTEERFEQTASVLDRFISGFGRAADTFDRHAAEVQGRSLLIVRETLTNSMAFAQQAMHVRQPQELFQLESEFVSKQAQTLAKHSRHFGRARSTSDRTGRSGFTFLLNYASPFVHGTWLNRPKGIFR